MSSSLGRSQHEEDIVFGYIKPIKIPKEVAVMILKFYHADTEVYVVGYNGNFSFGFGLKSKVVRYHKLKPQLDNGYNIYNIYNGRGYIIYSDQNNKTFWSAGCNDYGELCLGHLYRKKSLQHITYFNDNNIMIQNIFSDTSHSSIFWVDINGEMYGNGLTSYHQLGLDKDDLDNLNDLSFIYQGTKITKPVHINHSIKHIKDIQFGDKYTLILDKNGNIYSSGMDENNAHCQGKGSEIERFTKINKSEFRLKDINIIKIRSGGEYSLFLTSIGMMFGIGRNDFGQIGLGHKKNNVHSPILIDYFNQNKIKIVDIQCGGDYNLCIDINGQIYSFGYNNDNQCGDGTRETVLLPKPIDGLKNECIITIKCGYNHSFAHSRTDNYYFWGNNEYGQCITGPTKTPCLVNKKMKEQTENKRIKDVYLGWLCTQIIVYK